jgi:hypothetical protein
MDYGEPVWLREEPEPRLPRLPRRGGPWRTPKVPTIGAHATRKAWDNLAIFEAWPLIPTIDDDDIPF